MARYTFSLLVVLCAVVLSQGLRLGPKPNAPFKLPKLDNIKKSLNSKAIPAILGGLLILSNPSDSQALSSGGRSGGSSFRSSGSMRSYSAPTRSYSPSYSYGPTYIAPYYSPFPVFMPSFGGFGFLSNLIIIGGAAYIIGSAFGAFKGSGDEQSDSATVIKLNVAVNSDWGYDGIIPTISGIASSAGDLSQRKELSRLASETSLALLRKSSEWVAVSHEAKQFSNSIEDTESYFQRLSIKERSKFDRENAPQRLIQDGSRPSSSLAVVSIVIALRGKNNPSYKSVRSLADTKEILQALAADAMTDGGNNILAMELLWSPDNPSTIITDRDLIVDYPELMRL